MSTLKRFSLVTILVVAVALSHSMVTAKRVGTVEDLIEEGERIFFNESSTATEEHVELAIQRRITSPLTPSSSRRCRQMTRFSWLSLTLTWRTWSDLS